MGLKAGYTAQCIGTILPKEDGIQELVGSAASSQTVGSLFRVIHEQTQHSTWTTEANIALVGLAGRLLSPSTHPSRAARCIGAIHPKEDGIQGWAPSSQTVENPYLEWFVSKYSATHEWQKRTLLHLVWQADYFLPAPTPKRLLSLGMISFGKRSWPQFLHALGTYYKTLVN